MCLIPTHATVVVEGLVYLANLPIQLFPASHLYSTLRIVKLNLPLSSIAVKRTRTF